MTNSITALGSYTSITSDTVSKELYNNLLGARQKANADKEQLRNAVADALDQLEQGDSDSAQELLRAAYEATRVVIKSKDEDCGCGDK